MVCDYLKHHPSRAKASTVPTASVEQVLPAVQDLDQEVVLDQGPEEEALMPQDPVSQQPSLPHLTPPQGMAVDTEEEESVHQMPPSGWIKNDLYSALHMVVSGLSFYTEYLPLLYILHVRVRHIFKSSQKSGN